MKLKMLKYSVAAIFLLLSVSACAYSDTVRSTLIGFSEFREIKPDLYVSPKITSDQEKSIVTLISGARSRVKDRFGSSNSRPKIIISNPNIA